LNRKEIINDQKGSEKEKKVDESGKEYVEKERMIIIAYLFYII